MKRYVKSAIMSLKDEDPRAVVSILQKGADVETLEELMDNPNLSWVIKLAIIESDNVTRELLVRLSKDSNRTVSQAANYRLNSEKY